MAPTDDELTRHLHAMLGPDATFREGQREAIEAVIEDGAPRARGPADGLGQEPRLLDRDARPARPRPRADADHQPAARADAQPDRDGRAGSGLRAATINSGNVDEWEAVHQGLAADAIDVLLISPERLANERFTTDVLPDDPGLDRPVRRRRGALHLRLGPRLPARLPADRPHPQAPRPAACRSSPRRRRPTTAWWPTSPTSSAQAPRSSAGRSRGTPWTRRDRARRTRPNASPGSPSSIPQMPGSGIVYCLTVADTQRVATYLRAQGIDARAYNADLTTRGARGPRGRARRQRDQGARRDGRARDGLRQARSRLRRPLPAARARPSPTTSRSGAPVARSSTRTASSCPAARTTTSPSSSSTPRSRRP